MPTIPLILAFVVIFVAGPWLVFRLLRVPPGARVVRGLGLGIVGLIALAMLLQYSGQPLAATLCLWGAWVMSMALVVQVLRIVMGAGPNHRWSALAGAVGATIPWFGILVARMAMQ